MSNEEKRFWDKKKLLTLLIAILVISWVVFCRNATPTTTSNGQAQFVIASWNYPDEYGQGIESISAYENSTGEWLATEGDQYYYDSNIYTWYQNASIKLYVHTWLNNTIVGADDIEDGQRYFRHNVTVYAANQGTTIFSQVNLTYQARNAGDAPMWFYNYYVILDFIPNHGESYRVTVTYEVFYPVETYSEPHLATDGYGDPEPTGDYTDTHVKDESAIFNLDASDPYDVYIGLEFSVPDGDIASFDIHFYGYTFTLDFNATTKELLVWNGSTWNDVSDIAENSFGWTNITLDTSYIDSQTVYIRAHVVDDSMPTLMIDYVDIQFEFSKWYEMAEAEVVFVIAYDESGINMLLLFLGLFMIPASTLYLAKGGKDEMSMDKFFFGLLAFVMGIALFLAGIGY